MHCIKSRSDLSDFVASTTRMDADANLLQQHLQLPDGSCLKIS